MRALALKALAFLLAFFTVSFSAAADLFNSLPLVLPAVIFIMIAVLALVYMLARVLQSPQLDAWVKTEIRELIVAAILMAVIIGIFFTDVSGATIDEGIIKLITSSDDYRTAAVNFINSMDDKAANAFDDVMRAFHYVGLQSGYATSAQIPLFYSFMTYSQSPYGGVGSLFIYLSQAAGGLSNTMFLFSALRVLLDFFVAVSPRLIFLAFAFRFIPFTRQLGSTLIAVLLGTYVLFPFALALIAGFHGILENTPPTLNLSPRIDFGDPDVEGKMNINVPPGLNIFCRNTADSYFLRYLFVGLGEIGFALPLSIPCLVFFWACFSFLATFVYPILMIMLAITYTIILLAGPSTPPAVAVENIFNILQPFLRDVNNLVFLSYIDAIAVLLIVVIGIKSISTMLGGEYMIPGIQKFV